MREVAALTVKQVNAITKEGMTALGGARGLYLCVRGKSRSFIFRYKSPETGKKTSTAIGSTADLTLSEARAQARLLRSKVIEGSDPVLEARRAREERKRQKELAEKQGKTFCEAFDEWLSIL